MNQEIEKRLEPYRTDHLILLVGSNPLPNYVAAKLLARARTKIHLLCTRPTAGIAERIAVALRSDQADIDIRDTVEESRPETVRAALTQLVGNEEQAGSIPESDTIGLHYTGGTKAMAANAYHFLLSKRPKTVCSYLDAQQLDLVIDGSHPDGPDKIIPVGDAVQMSLEAVADLHNIQFETKPQRTPKLLGLCVALQREHESNSVWPAWRRENLLRKDRQGEPRSSTELRGIVFPRDQFPGLCAAVAKLGAKDDTFIEWARACGNAT
ncbi:MAG: hypothetical protein ABIQ99_07795, partial [Thermoflexales bacterium]